MNEVPESGPEEDTQAKTDGNLQDEKSVEKQGAVTSHEARDITEDPNPQKVLLYDRDGNAIDISIFDEGPIKVFDQAGDQIAEGDLTEDEGINLDSGSDPYTVVVGTDDFNISFVKKTEKT